jgi:AI-2 transport protein TqsA
MPIRNEGLGTYWKVQTFCLITLTMIAVGAALYFLRPVLVPFVLAVFLTNCLMAVSRLQQHYLRLPRSLAIASTVILAIVLLTLCGSLVAESVGSASTRLASYEKQFQQFTESAAHWVPLNRFGIRLDDGRMTRYFAVQEGTGWQFISAVLTDAANVLSSGMLVLVFMLFLVAGRMRAGRRSPVLVEIETSVQRYTVNLVVLAFATALLVGLAFAMLGVDMAWAFAFLTFLLNFVPTVGAIIASLLPLPVIVFNPQMSVGAKIAAILIPVVVHFLLGSFVQPKVQGDSLTLHPVAVLLAIMFFGMIWGIIGAFLAAPLAAVARIICARIPLMEPIADLLAGDLTVLSGGPK